MICRAVSTAAQLRFTESSLARRTRHLARSSACSSDGPKSVLAQPVPHGSLTAPYALGDIRDRQPGLYQRYQLCQGQRSLWSVLLVPDRFKAVSLDPVGNRRFVAREPASDLSQGQSFVQQLLQGNAIHAPHCLQRLGRNRASGHAARAARGAVSPPGPLSPRARAHTPGRTGA
jgi:hypothetical protein